MISIARPYAKAIFAHALEAQKLPEWANFLRSAALVINDSQIVHLLNNPKVSQRKLAEFILQICQACAVTGAENVLYLLAEKHRLAVLPQIANLFELYRAQQEKWINVFVTTALPLSEMLQQKLKHSLEKRLQRNIILNCCEDHRLIGGAVIKADDLVIDGSVRRQLVRLAAQLKL